MRKIIDAHCHIGLYRGRKWSSQKLLNVMNEFKVNKAIIFPTGGHGPTNFINENNTVISAVHKYPERLVGFARVNPHFSDKAIEEIKRTVALGLKGVKLHPMMEVFPANSRLVDPIMDTAAKLRIPVLIHSGNAPFALPSQVADIASRFPKVQVIMGHMGKIDLGIEAIPSAKRSENVFLETSGARRFTIEDAVSSLGPDRVVFGSDWPYSHPAPELMKIKILGISEEHKMKILGENIQKILKKSK